MVDERAFTARLGRFFGTHRDVLVGIGDDAAVVVPRGRGTVLCCDPVIEGVHFRSEAPPQLVGRKAVNRNLADLAAMGATADWLLVSLILPRGYPARSRTALLRGLRAAARLGGAVVVGGDVATSAGPLTVTVTAVGHVDGRALTRGGARVGDSLHVSGPLGVRRLAIICASGRRWRSARGWRATTRCTRRSTSATGCCSTCGPCCGRAAGSAPSSLSTPCRSGQRPACCTAGIASGRCRQLSGTAKTTNCCGPRRLARSCRVAGRCRAPVVPRSAG